MYHTHCVCTLWRELCTSDFPSPLVPAVAQCDGVTSSENQQSSALPGSGERNNNYDGARREGGREEEEEGRARSVHC